MLKVQIKVVEQVLTEQHVWAIPVIVPAFISKIKKITPDLTIENRVCTNLDEFFYNFLLRLNRIPVTVHPEMEFDNMLIADLKEKYELDFNQNDYINHQLYMISDLKKGEKNWKEINNLTVSHAFFTSCLARADFYLNNFFKDYRLLVCFKQISEPILPTNSFLSSSII